MVALLVLAADGTSATGTRMVLFVLLLIAILLILTGAIIAIITMFTYLKERSSKADVVTRLDTLPGE